MIKSIVDHLMGERPLWAPSDSEKLSEWSFIKLVDEQQRFSKLVQKKRVLVCSRCATDLRVDKIPSRTSMDCPNCRLRFRRFPSGAPDFCDDVYAWES